MANSSKYLIAAASAAAAFIVYLFTLAPSVVQIDAGELAAVQLTAGIAHPTGYPLFAILGWLFGALPLGLRPILQMNVLAALYCAGAVYLTTLTLFRAFGHFAVFSFAPKNKAQERRKARRKDPGKTVSAAAATAIPQEIPPMARIAAAAAGGLTLAFNKTFWFQSTSVEVYSLHVFLMSFILWALLRAWTAGAETEKPAERAWYIVAVALAFGFSNHLTTLLILPGAAYVFFTVNGFRKSSFILAAKMLAVFFVLLAAAYMYLPLRAAANPPLNWGNPVDAERLLRHISGKQYQVWMFVSMEAAAKQFSYFFSNITTEYTAAFLLLAAGIGFLLRRAPKFLIFAGGTAVAALLYAVNYDIADIDSYFLLVYIALALINAAGALWWLTTEAAGSLNTAARIAVLAAVIAAQAAIAYPNVNQHGTHIYDDYTNAILRNAGQDALVFSYQWDYFISASYYFQRVEKVRPDVAIVDKELLRRSWYYAQMNRNYAPVIAGIRDDIEMFLKGLRQFEREEPFDANYLETYYRRIMTGLIATNIDRRPCYLGPELVEGEMQRGEFTLPEGCRLVPELFLFRVVKDTLYHPAPARIPVLRFPERRDKYAENIYQIAAGMLSRRAMYEMQYRFTDRAKFYIKKLRTDYPDYPLPDPLSRVMK